MTSTIDVRPEATPVQVTDTRVRNAVAILVSRFPRIDETFILREINELERQGQPVVLVPLMREDARVIHEEAKPWIRRALYHPLHSATIVGANLRELFKHPVRYTGLLARLIVGTLMHPQILLRTVLLFPKSVYLASVLPRLGIKHVHAHFATHATTMAYIIASLTDITYSFTVHGPDIFVYRFLLTRKIAKAKFIRAASTFNKAFLLGLYPVVTGEKVEVIHVGVNPDVYAEAASEAPRVKTRPLVLSVAALAPSKGFPFLIDAVARLKKAGVDVECKIVGDGPLRDVTERWIVQHDLSSSVRVTGLLPQHEVARLMGESDVFVLPSVIANNGNMDGIPVSLMEAMAAGKPVVAAALSGIPELVDNESSGMLVDATHPERIAAAIQRLVENPALRESMGRAGQRRVREAFDVRQIAAELIELFERHEEAALPAAESIARLNWNQLGVCALGIRKIRERPESRIAEVTVTDGISKRDAVVKQQKPRTAAGRSPAARARHEFDVLSRLRVRLAEASAEATSDVFYTVPNVLLFDRENASIIMERARGVPLQALVRDARSRSKPAALLAPLRRAGTWLRVLDQATRTADDGRHLLTAVIFIALRDLDIAAVHDRVIRKNREMITDRLRALESKVGDRPLPTVGSHGDYWPGNVFIGERRVEVIDFEWYRDGLPFEDAAYFLVHLRMRFGNRGLIAKLEDTFLSGYAGVLNELERDMLDLFKMIKAIQLFSRSGESDEFKTWNRGILRELIVGLKA